MLRNPLFWDIVIDEILPVSDDCSDAVRSFGRRLETIDVDSTIRFGDVIVSSKRKGIAYPPISSASAFEGRIEHLPGKRLRLHGTLALTRPRKIAQIVFIAIIFLMWIVFMLIAFTAGAGLTRAQNLFRLTHVILPGTAVGLGSPFVFSLINLPNYLISRRVRTQIMDALRQSVV